MSFRSRLDEIPILRSAATTVPAVRYNRVRLALRRLENPLRLELPRLRSLDMILEDEAWALVDRGLGPRRSRPQRHPHRRLDRFLASYRLAHAAAL